MPKHTIKFYPVGNGDMSLITLKNKKTLLIDCNIRQESQDDMDDPEDVKDDLLESIQKDNNTPFVDIFALSHPDNDHCRGFSRHFYTGDPEDYTEENQENEEIRVDELWVTRRLFHLGHNEDANEIRNEANRRRKLYENDDPKKNKDGNRLVIIGYDGEENLDDIPHYYSGEVYDEIGGETQDEFSIFIHAPFKKDLINTTAEKDKNNTSIIFQVQFFDNAVDKENGDFCYRAIFGGDADHYQWEEVLNKTEKNNNKEALEWDIFLAPHHCSWSFFNDTPYTDNPDNQEPRESSLKILDYNLGNAKVIASCVKIRATDDDPPHKAAKDEYLKKVTEDNFLNTAIEPKEGDPKPIVIEIEGDNKATEDKKKALIDIGKKADKPWVNK